MPTTSDDGPWGSWLATWTLVATVGLCCALLVWGPFAVACSAVVVGSAASGIRAVQLGPAWSRVPVAELRAMLRHCGRVGLCAASCAVALAVLAQASLLLAVSAAVTGFATTPPFLDLVRRRSTGLDLHGAPGPDFVDHPVRFRP